jgi:hypothetical protein
MVVDDKPLGSNEDIVSILLWYLHDRRGPSLQPRNVSGKVATRRHQRNFNLCYDGFFLADARKRLLARVPSSVTPEARVPFYMRA